MSLSIIFGHFDHDSGTLSCKTVYQHGLLLNIRVTYIFGSRNESHNSKDTGALINEHSYCNTRNIDVLIQCGTIWDLPLLVIVSV